MREMEDDMRRHVLPSSE